MTVSQELLANAHVLQGLRARAYAESYWSGDVRLWVVVLRLNCHSCTEVTVARMALGSYLEFSQRLKKGLVQCDCGGILTQSTTLVKLIS